MRRRKGTEFGVIESLPLATRSQDIEDGISAGTVSPARSSSSKAMGIDTDGQQRLQHCPQLIRNPESRGRAVIRRSPPLSRLGVLFAHASKCSRFFG
jgi:hypothetical protein